MRDSKLYKSLTQLSGHELNKLHRFILSPYFNRNDAINNLFDWIKSDLKSPKGEPTKEELWRISFGNTEFDDGRFRKLQSDLLRLIEDFYAQEVFESNPIQKANNLLDSINEQELEHLAPNALASAERLSNSQKFRSSSYYYYLYLIEQSKYNLTTSQAERREKSNIELIVQNLDRFYLSEKLRYYCTILNHQHIAALNYEVLFINEIIDHIENHDYSDVPPILIYYQILLTYKNPELKIHYDELKRLIDQHIHLFPESEAKEILDAALNYSLKRMNAGETEYIRETFNLYKNFLESGTLLVKGQITPWSFKNIVTTGLRLNEFDWIENFIHTYSEKLDPKLRVNAITFNLAQFYFYKKDYPKVISQLNQVEYDDITYNLNSKTLLMASYYELDEMDALGSLLSTFRVYLSRNKEIPPIRRKHYINTINIVRRMSRILPGDKIQIDRLKNEVETGQGIVSKNWILEKLAKLQS